MPLAPMHMSFRLQPRNCFTSSEVPGGPRVEVFFYRTRSATVTSRQMPPFSRSLARGRGRVTVGVALLALVTGCMGAHVQAGPTIGYAFKRGTTIGWEAGAGTIGIVRASTGGTYRLEPAPEPEKERGDPAQPADTRGGASAAPPEGLASAHDDGGPSPDAIHYVALEPLGVSLGITFPNIGKPGFLGGVWAGWVFDPHPDGAFGYAENPDPLRPSFDCESSRPEPGFLLSGAIGLRYMGGEWEAYFTPKAVILWCLEYAS
jgi:hypothetical protein